jgi:hypothetical protein
MENLKVIEVVTETDKMSVPELIEAATLVKTTGDAIAGGAPVTDLVLHGAANTLQTLYNGSLASPPTVLKKAVTTQFNIVKTMYNKNAGYMKGVANDAAIAAGDVGAGTVVVIRCGFKLKHDRTPTTKGFKATSTIVNQVDITTKSVGVGAIYIREYGITLTKDVPPTMFAELLISKRIGVSITNIKSGTIIAIREASILPIPRKKASTSTSATARSASTTAATKGEKVVFSDGATSHYNYGNWIYVVVK